MTKFFKKSTKPYFGQLLHKFRGKWVFLEKSALTVFKYSNYLPWCKNSEKSNNPFLIKVRNCWLTEKQTDRELWFYRTLHRTGVQKIKFGTGYDSLWVGKNNRNLNPYIKIMVHRSNMHYSRINKKGNWKKHIQFLLELQKMRPPKHLVQLPHLEGWVRYLDIDTQLNSLKIDWIQRLLIPTNASWKDLMLYWFN